MEDLVQCGNELLTVLCRLVACHELRTRYTNVDLNAELSSFRLPPMRSVHCHTQLGNIRMAGSELLHALQDPCSNECRLGHILDLDLGCGSHSVLLRAGRRDRPLIAQPATPEIHSEGFSISHSLSPRDRATTAAPTLSDQTFTVDRHMSSTRSTAMMSPTPSSGRPTA